MSNPSARQVPRISNPEFQTHRLNEQGNQKVDAVRIAFDVLLNEVKEVIPDSRYLALVKTNLEEAAMFAVKGISVQSVNQE